MHVLHTISGLSQAAGGTTVAVLGYCHALASLGLQITIAIPHGCNIPVDDQRKGLRIVVEPKTAMASTRVFAANSFERFLRHLLGETRPDILHSHALWDLRMHAACRAAYRGRVPYVVSPHGMLEPWAVRHRRWKKQLALRLFQRTDLQRADCLHATATAEASQLGQFVHTTPITTVPIGVSPPDFVQAGSDHKQAHTALFLSRIHRVKGLLNLVEAWRRLRPEGWRLEIVGPDEGGHRKEVEEAVRAAKLDKHVTFMAPLCGVDKWRALSRASLLVLPSFNENFGIVVPEALACGTPVITTVATPWQELEEHRCGWWIETGVEPLLKALKTAIETADSERRSMGARGRQLVTSKYTWPAIASQMHQLYEEVLRNEK